MVRLWLIAEGSGFAQGLLPAAGGSADQAWIMLAAFNEMSEARREIEVSDAG